MADLGDQINRAKDVIGNLIAKPKMTDKLLSKPPFRFLHDTISAVISTTGFGEGLYSDAELDCASITDKNAKIAYLEKVFLLVGICTGSALEVKATRVVAGLEPEHTVAFLIAFGEVANDPR
jgi:TRAF3-interacting protein 1